MPKLTKQQKETCKTLQQDVNDNWPLRKGKNEFLKSLGIENVGAGGKELTRKEAILAQCYHCCGGYEGGPRDCLEAICPLYEFMPYRDARSRVEMPEEQKAQLIARLKAGKLRAQETVNES